MPEFAKKRRFPRIASQILVRLQRLDEGGVGELFTTRTIGLGGCMVVQERSLGTGVPVRLVFCLGDDVVEAKGRSLYELVRKDGCFDVGIEFTELPSETRAALDHLFAK